MIDIDGCAREKYASVIKTFVIVLICVPTMYFHYMSDQESGLNSRKGQ